MTEKVLEKRVLTATKREGLSAADLILVGILLAAGLVLKITVGTVVNFGMKPNFIIAMYCLAILLVKPKIHEALIIGILAGAVCQLLPGTPWLNLISEPLGAAAMFLLIKLPLKLKKADFRPIISVFFSTLVSGFAYIGAMYLAFYSGADVTPTPLAAFMAIIFGTAAINAIIVQILYIPLKMTVAKDK